MKTTYVRIYLFVMVCSLKTVTCFAQPVIKVPRYCEVVVLGNGQGTSTGFGGTVGDGGIVVMPDPFDYPGEEGNFYSSLNEFELIKWELFGDLSFQTETNYNEAIQFVAGVNPVNIQSYNKKLRFGEMPSASLPNLDTRWARSKGRIVVTYYDRRCINKITFDVFKRYKSDRKKNLVPPIDGADCVLPNTVYTFSVDPIASDNPNDEIGFDKYYWSGIPENCTLLYTAADNSSITFKTGESVSSFTLQCCYGRANEWDGENGSNHTTCVSKLIIGTALHPEYSIGPPICHPSGTESFNIVYPNTNSGSYVWTSSNLSWQISSVIGASTTTVTVTTPDNNPGTLTLTITSVCNTTTTINYQVNRSLTGTSLIVPNSTSPGSTCMTAGSSNNQFFLGNNASANNVTWTVTSPLAGAAANITLSSVIGQPNSTVAVAIGANAPVNTTYTLTATANTTPACNATSATYTFNVRPLTPTITGTSCVVKGALTPQTYTCTASVGANYNWVFPAGWTAPGNNFTTTTNSITVTPASATAVLNGNAFVTATGTGTCNSPQSAAFAINYNPIIPSGITFANTCFNFGIPTSSTFTVNNAPSPFYGSYTITSTPAGLFTSTSVNPATGVISFTTAANASGSYGVTVQHTTPSCGNASNPTPFTVVISGNGSTIPAPTLNPTLGECDIYTVTGRPAGSNNTNTQWFVNGGSALVSNGTTIFINPSASQLQLCGANTTITSVCVQVTSAGCTTRVCAPNVGTHGTARLSNPNGTKIKVYPNPNDGNFDIQIDEIKESASATITDMTGKQLGTYELTKGENKIKNKNLSSGTYIVVIDVDGKQESQRIIIK